MGQTSLVEPYRRFLSESQLILATVEYSFNQSIKSPTHEHEYKFMCEMSIIRLLDAWARFCRYTVILSAGGRPVTRTGTRLPLAPGVRKTSDVIPVLLSKYPNRRFEPRWHDAYECVDAAQRLAIVNFRSFSSAIGATNSPSGEIRTLRNYFAHRNEETAIRAKLTFNISQIEVFQILSQITLPGTARINGWVTDLRNIASASIT